MSKTKTHVIDARRCKSCGLCVDARPGVLVSVRNPGAARIQNYIEQAHPEKCVLCTICGGWSVPMSLLYVVEE